MTGTTLGPYELLKKLGEGGMGEVYRARDTRLGRIVAVKVLPPDVSSSTDRRERFDREARAIASLSHPHICTLFDVGRDAGIDYLVMEHLSGDTLAGRMARAHSDGRGASPRRASRRCARRGARAGHRPSRPEAGQHHDPRFEGLARSDACRIRDPRQKGAQAGDTGGRVLVQTAMIDRGVPLGNAISQPDSSAQAIGEVDRNGAARREHIERGTRGVCSAQV